MNKDIILGWLLGTASSLLGILLQYFLTHRQTKIQSLIEARRVVYAKLVSATMSEWKYPGEPSREALSEDRINKFNEHLNEWRRNRKAIKSLAAEALLLAQNSDLRQKLKEFISSSDPEKRLVEIEELLRREIEIS